MKNLLTLNYWFNLAPEPFVLLAQKLFIVFILALAAAAIIIAIYKNRGGIYRGFLNRLYALCLTNAIIGLIFLFVNFETIPFFSARFWLGFWVISMVIWLVPILKTLKTIPERKKAQDKESERKKYLPK